ncbi:MAG: PEP/pyruvate-binding domain-containing protein [Patescibacteria group bacterium]|nr:PEP/pyruvate-binding domain-containing protein [Patescibacteria group bacterium]MCL5095726.1 PEP/pyruvate-binding domain-containing protein [Patescibacteria group bacterium]
MKYVKDLLESSIKTERVEGFKKLAKARLPIPDVKIIDNQAFLLCEKKGITEPLQKEIEAVFFNLKKKYPRRGFYVGRAFSVPGFTNPPGPYSVVRSAKDMIKGVEKLYNFACQSRYNKKGAKIGVIIHPWIDPKAPFGGGCLTLSNSQQKVIIEAIYGLDEGVQSFPHDFYIVDFETEKILEKVVAEKKEDLEVNNDLMIRSLKIPRNLWNKAVFSDKQILQVISYFKHFVKTYGPHRMEFAFEREGLFFRECIPFLLTKEKAPHLKEEGSVFRLNTKSDLPKIGKEQRIIFVDPIVIKKRQMNLLTFLATNSQDKKIILYPGSASTGHAATIFRETGHLVVFIGNQIFKDKDKVLVETKNGELAVKRL